jgi:hypothetical protein
VFLFDDETGGRRSKHRGASLYDHANNSSTKDKMIRNSKKLYRLITFLAMLGAMVGCSAIQQKVEMDTSTAAVIAANAGDTTGAACFKALEPVAGTAPAGVLSKFEVVRAGRIAVEEGPCAPLAAELLLHLLNKVPGTP